MHEVICINIGQAGVQLSNAAWELFCIEHGIECNGRLKENLEDDSNQAFNTFFCEAPNGQYVPRSLTIDLEPTVIDEIRTGAYRNLFHPDQLININEDGSNNFARAHFSIGKTLVEHVIDTLRKIVENCNSLQGFFLLHSHGGGTGSGFTSLVLKSLNIEFAKNPRFQLSIFPSVILSSAIVEPYNCILSSTSDIEQSDITTIVNNEAIYGICNKMLNIIRPSFSNINRVISHVFSDLTVSMRFESSLSADFAQMSTNLIPYPRIHFPLVCHAPYLSSNKADHVASTTMVITRSIFEESNQLIKCETENGLYMSCVMQYRGNVTPKDVNEAIFEIKRRQDIKFVDWCPTGFKIGISAQASATVLASDMAPTDRSLTMVSNTTAIKDPMEKILAKFQILLNKRSFVHWFVGEGMEEGEFIEANNEISNLIMDYDELGMNENDDIEDDDKDDKDTTRDKAKLSSLQTDDKKAAFTSKHSSESRHSSKISLNEEDKPNILTKITSSAEDSEEINDIIAAKVEEEEEEEEDGAHEASTDS